MALRDYAAIDEDDFYSQGFGGKKGHVSVWIGMTDGANDPEELDVLQDLCGVGYYDLDDQEGNCLDFRMVPLRELLQEVSYSSSFMDAVVDAAAKRNLHEARWVLMQYGFAYDPSRVKRPIASDPIFLGVFAYQPE